ncbi:carbonic anhydrase family protein [Paenibacillus sp. TRM 82003]|uniref:carbonic anhydrase n=1 Tax=Kineococcus sp. TRM81007 TaxID=2925831 RepID=UPI001F56DBFB|nr:carbonic anhydrase family protein [Kineococcus sp. TRM81007]MCI2240389.1 carbonic anhydrase family protein [Kineococcus sp. TRM81007]MCI3927435.1 carbonic anhydrase family protein [Paenibacillus sp. TRM 82003]
MNRRATPVLALTAALAVLSGCGEDPGTSPEPGATPSASTPGTSTTAPAAVRSAGAQREVEFAYEGERGPANWASLSEEYAECADAAQQSPVDLAGATTVPLPDLRFDYATADVELDNTVHTVQAVEPAGSTVGVDGRTYALKQFHLHEPAEHALDGQTLAGELHLVHTDDSGAVAVVGVLLRQGEANPALTEYFANLPAGPGERATLTGFDTEALLPQDRRTFRYTGSLTTPPCTEGVSWFVVREPVEVSAQQLADFRSVVAENSRPLQPLGGRELLLDAD